MYFLHQQFFILLSHAPLAEGLFQIDPRFFQSFHGSFHIFYLPLEPLILTLQLSILSALGQFLAPGIFQLAFEL
jgi:hypothetical protein